MFLLLYTYLSMYVFMLFFLCCSSSCGSCTGNCLCVGTCTFSFVYGKHPLPLPPPPRPLSPSCRRLPAPRDGDCPSAHGLWPPSPTATSSVALPLDQTPGAQQRSPQFPRHMLPTCSQATPLPISPRKGKVFLKRTVLCATLRPPIDKTVTACRRLPQQPSRAGNMTVARL